MEDGHMTKKDLKYFMNSKEPEIVRALGPESFKDEDGNTLMFEIKVLTQKQIQDINDNYKEQTIATDKKGNPLISGNEVVWKTKKDNARATRHIIAEALQYPDLKDPELMAYYKCNDITEMPLNVFPKVDDFQHVNRIVMKALGFVPGMEDGDDEDLEAAKN